MWNALLGLSPIPAGIQLLDVTDPIRTASTVVHVVVLTMLAVLAAAARRQRVVGAGPA